MSYCDEFRQWLEDSSGVELAEGEPARELSAHLRECGNCAAKLSEARALARAMAAWETPSPRVNIQARVMASIARQEQERAARGSRVREFVSSLFGARIQVPTFALATVLILLVASLAWNILGNRRHAPVQTQFAVQPQQAVTQFASGAQLPPAFTTPGVQEAVRQVSASVVPPGTPLVPMMVVLLGVPPTAHTVTGNITSTENVF